MPWRIMLTLMVLGLTACSTSKTVYMANSNTRFEVEEIAPGVEQWTKQETR